MVLPPSVDGMEWPFRFDSSHDRMLWTVVRKTRMVERWTGPDLATREECREKLVTPLLPGFELDVASLLRD